MSLPSFISSSRLFRYVKFMIDTSDVLLLMLTFSIMKYAVMLC